jgi:hypothetical protein
VISSETRSSLPGADLVQQGLEDLAGGSVTIPALLVSIGAPRLRRVLSGVPDATIPDPEHTLYLVLAEENPLTAHSRYNAYIRRLVSFERAAECAS